jgi:hypothetical protein
LFAIIPKTAIDCVKREKKKQKTITADENDDENGFHKNGCWKGMETSNKMKKRGTDFKKATKKGDLRSLEDLSIVTDEWKKPTTELVEPLVKSNSLLNWSIKSIRNGKRDLEVKFVDYEIIIVEEHQTFYIEVSISSKGRALTNFIGANGDHVFPVVGNMQMMLAVISNQGFKEVINQLKMVSYITFFNEDEGLNTKFQQLFAQFPGPLDEEKKSVHKRMYQNAKNAEDKDTLAYFHFKAEKGQAHEFMQHLRTVCDDLIAASQSLPSLTILRGNKLVKRTEERPMNSEKFANQAFVALNCFLELNFAIKNHEIEPSNIKVKEKLERSLEMVNLQLHRRISCDPEDNSIHHYVRYGLNMWVGDEESYQTKTGFDRLCTDLQVDLKISNLSSLKEKLSRLFQIIKMKKDRFTQFQLDYLDFHKSLEYEIIRPKMTTNSDKLPPISKNKSSTQVKNTKTVAHSKANPNTENKKSSATPKISADLQCRARNSVQKYFPHDSWIVKLDKVREMICVTRRDSLLEFYLPKYLMYLKLICPRIFDFFYEEEDAIKSAAKDFIEKSIDCGFWSTDDTPQERLIRRTQQNIDILLKGVAELGNTETEK